MKPAFLSIFVIASLATSSHAQWKDFGFDSPQAFGIHDGCFFASQMGGPLYRYAPATPDKWVLADTGMSHLVSAMGSLVSYFFAGCNGGGIFRSTDNGSHWAAINKGFSDPHVMAIVTMNSIIFAGGVGPFPGDGGGIWRSFDNGTNWTQTDAGVPNKVINALAVMGPKLFAGTAGGVFLSTDSGNSWQPTSIKSGIGPLCTIGSIILAGTGGNAGILRSVDGGITWTVSNTGLSNHSVTSLVSDGKNIFAGTGSPTVNGNITDGSGVFLSTDSGSTWDTVNTGLPEGIDGYLNISTLCVFDTLLIAGAWSNDGQFSKSFVRPLSEMTAKSAVREVSTPSNDTLSIYPNPATGFVTIRAVGTSLLGVSVLNVLGENMLDIPNSHASDLTLDLSKFPSGTYFLRIETAEESLLRKIVKE